MSASNPNRAHTEIMVAADPENSSRLIACSMIWSGQKNALSSGIYASFDNGTTWSLALDDTLDQRVWDPFCTYGLNGMALFGTAAEAKRGNRVYRSTDGGRTWGQPTRLPSMDRPYFAVDRSNGTSRGRVYLYVNGDLPKEGGEATKTEDSTIEIQRPPLHQPQILASTDGGATFQGPVGPKSAETFMYATTVPGYGVVLDDGTFLAPYATMRLPKAWVPGQPVPPDTIELVSKANVGGTVESRVIARLGATQLPSDKPGCYENGPGKNTGYPALDIDRSQGPYRGRLYLLYGDARNGRCAIVLSTSDDRGKNWTAPVTVDDAPSFGSGKGPDSFLPALAVNNDGIVGVSWYDRREDPKNIGHRMRFTASLDGGDTFLPSVPVSESPFTFDASGIVPITASASSAAIASGSRRPTTNRTRTTVNFAPRLYRGAGDTAGLAADANGAFHIFWTDNRTGIMQLYTSRVIVKGRPERNGTFGLSTLVDATDKVAFGYTRALYDPKTRIVTLDARLTNTSKDSIIGPLKVRVVTLGSTIARVRSLDSDNEEKSIGAIWDFTNQIKGGVLAPGDVTEPRTLRFELQEMKGLPQERSDRFLEFETKVFAQPSKSPSH